LADLWRSAFIVLFERVANDLSSHIAKHHNDPLCVWMTQNQFRMWPKNTNLCERLTDALNRVHMLLHDKSLVLVMDEAQAIGTTYPNILENDEPINEILSRITRIFPVSVVCQNNNSSFIFVFS